MSNDDSMTKVKPRIKNSNVSKGDVLIDEVFINATVAKIGVEDAATISIKILLSWSNPNGKLFWFLNVDVLIQNIGDTTASARVTSSELHVDSFPSMMHKTVSEGDVIDIAGTNGSNSEAYSTCSNSFE